MGANPTQAYGVLLFLAAFTALIAGIAGGGVLPLALGVILLAGSLYFFWKAKPWETREP